MTVAPATFWLGHGKHRNRMLRRAAFIEHRTVTARKHVPDRGIIIVDGT
jgi:hypothetical protein